MDRLVENARFHANSAIAKQKTKLHQSNFYHTHIPKQMQDLEPM
jgi:hypothetical protein